MGTALVCGNGHVGNDGVAGHGLRALPALRHGSHARQGGTLLPGIAAGNGGSAESRLRWVILPLVGDPLALQRRGPCGAS